MKKQLTTVVCTLAMLVGLNTTASAQCVGPAGGPPWTYDENNPVSFTCTVPGVSNISDVTLTVDITHTWVGDLELSITPPGSPAVLIFEDLSNTTGECAENNMRITLTDVGTDGDITDCNNGGGSANPAYTDGGTYTTVLDNGVDIGAVFDGLTGVAEPKTTLGSFKGMSTMGAWTLDFSDDAGGDAGTIDSAPVLTVTGTPLPVELVSFEGILDNDAVELRWVTATEDNNSGFEIEQKTANGDFETIAFVEGAGTTREEQNYTFRVADVDFGNHSFRLKQIDFDGTFAYSHDVEVTRELANGYMLAEAYPNPFNPQTNFSLLVAKDQQVDVGVYNMLGQRIHTIFSGVLTGQEWHQMTFQSTSLPSGTYLIRSTGESFVNTQKVILMK